MGQLSAWIAADDSGVGLSGAAHAGQVRGQGEVTVSRLAGGRPVRGAVVLEWAHEARCASARLPCGAAGVDGTPDDALATPADHVTLMQCTAGWSRHGDRDDGRGWRSVSRLMSGDDPGRRAVGWPASRSVGSQSARTRAQHGVTLTPIIYIMSGCVVWSPSRTHFALSPLRQTNAPQLCAPDRLDPQRAARWIRRRRSRVS